MRDVEERDRYGRLLAYVYRARDGLFVNAELVRRGYATVATFPPNVAHEREFRRLAKRRAIVRTRTMVGVRGCGLSDRSAGDRPVVALAVPMRMRQSLAEIEEAFVDEIEEDRHRRERLRAEAEQRTRRRRSTRTQRQGTTGSSCSCSRSSRPPSS